LYAIQTSPDSINWTTATILVNTNGGVEYIDVTSPAQAQRFYRVVKQPWRRLARLRQGASGVRRSMGQTAHFSAGSFSIDVLAGGGRSRIAVRRRDVVSV
jgi:hypothetical protein